MHRTGSTDTNTDPFYLKMKISYCRFTTRNIFNTEKPVNISTLKEERVYFFFSFQLIPEEWETEAFSVINFKHHSYSFSPRQD